jgi:hypothetical protein
MCDLGVPTSDMLNDPVTVLSLYPIWKLSLNTGCEVATVQKTGLLETHTLSSAPQTHQQLLGRKTRSAGQPLSPGLGGPEGNREDVTDFEFFEDVVVADDGPMNQPELSGPGAVPIVTVRNGVDVQLGPVLAHERFEECLGFIDLRLVLGSTFLGDFGQQADGSFVLACGHLFVVDAALLEPPVQVQYRGGHADRTDNGERSRQHLVGNASHHIAAADCHLVDAHGETNVVCAQASQLRGGQPVVRNQAAVALQPNDNLVVRARDLKNRRDLLAEAPDRTGDHVAAEVEHEYLGGRVRLGRLAPMPLFKKVTERFLSEQRTSQRLHRSFEVVVELAHMDDTDTVMAPAQDHHEDDSSAGEEDQKDH